MNTLFNLTRVYANMKATAIMVVMLLGVAQTFAQQAYVASNGDDKVYVIDVATGMVSGSIDVPGSPIKVVPSPDGSQIAGITSSDVFFIDVATGTVNSVSTGGQELREIIYNPDGSTVYAIDQLSTLIYPVNSSTFTVGNFGFLAGFIGPLAAAYNAEGNNIVVVNAGSGNVVVVDPSTLLPTGAGIRTGRLPQDVVFIPGTETAYVTSFGQARLSIVDVAAGAGAGDIRDITEPSRITVSADGSTLYTILSDGTVAVVDVAGGTVTTNITVSSNPEELSDLNFGPDGLLYVLNRVDGSVSVIDPATNMVTNTFASTGDNPLSVVLVEAAANVGPTASFTANPTSGVAPLDVDFDASGSTDPDDGIASYSWDFGNGDSGSGVTASTTYATAGSYTVTLTVTDNSGESDMATTTITVEEPGIEDCLQAAVDAQTFTSINGLPFGGVSTAVVLADGSVLTASTGSATPVIQMDETFVLGTSDAAQTIYSALAVALMQEGTITGNDPISDYIDVSTYDNIAGDITIRELLTHTSGLDDFASDADYGDFVLFDVNEIFTADDIIAEFVGPAGARGDICLLKY